MSACVYVDGDFVAPEQAKVSAFDRGFLFADGVYEVSAVLEGRLIDNQAHLDRFERSMAALDLSAPVTRENLVAIQKALIARNDLKEGLVYLQVTRGPADRDFAFPATARPTLFAFTQAKNIIEAPAAVLGVAAVSAPDLRWARCDIKSIALLAQVMAKQAARQAGGAEAFLVRDDLVVEGASSTPFIVTQAGEILTRALSPALLPGVTRAAVLCLAQEADLRVVERAFSLEEVWMAAECFFTSATAFVMPVVALDGRKIADGRPGLLTQRLRTLYIEEARRTAE